MYADRVEDETKRSVKERLNGSIKGDSMRRRQAIGKRQRQDDKWEHDLYEGDEYQVSSKVDSRDLRLKLQRKSLQQTTVRGAFSGVRDLREKLSGTMHPQPVNIHQQKPKVEPARLPGKSVASEILAPETKKVVNPPPRKKSSHKVNASVDEFLQSLGLEKYSITFQAEEIDMTALVHMSDEDLKAIGIPMGPRKKILLALESRA
ncbi:uncharacterized protein LOC107426714 [Ziziphus jujuba]|uniref:Uncharacterized protein LOC107426714 n=1 Tax=Ziziphus jujuba TaxID=326968 RepID=A0A6P4ADH9_ZIZJJ|nr:uncharacterized protein LOC107426714 [Ziziphus jujuba]